jgi:uncharacterized protein (TIGR02246 family)
MRALALRVVVALATVLPAGCGQSGLPDPDAVRAGIEQHNAEVMRAYAAGDAAAVAAIFTEDAWQMPPHSPPLIGRKAIGAFWQQALTWGKWQFDLKTLAVTVSGPLAIERGHYRLTFEPGSAAPPGMVAFEDKGNYLVQWRREHDGEWRAVADAPVSELALPAGPAH